MTATKTDSPDKAKPAAKDAIALLKVDQNATCKHDLLVQTFKNAKEMS